MASLYANRLVKWLIVLGCKLFIAAIPLPEGVALREQDAAGYFYRDPS